MQKCCGAKSTAPMLPRAGLNPHYFEVLVEDVSVTQICKSEETELFSSSLPNLTCDATIFAPLKIFQDDSEEVLRA